MQEIYSSYNYLITIIFIILFKIKNTIYGGITMVHLRVLEILKEQGHTKYWLYKRMDMSYQNFNKMVTNGTSSIRFDNIDRLSSILGVPVGELFMQDDDTAQLKE